MCIRSRCLNLYFFEWTTNFTGYNRHGARNWKPASASVILQGEILITSLFFKMHCMFAIYCFMRWIIKWTQLGTCWHARRVLCKGQLQYCVLLHKCIELGICVLLMSWLSTNIVLWQNTFFSFQKITFKGNFWIGLSENLESCYSQSKNRVRLLIWCWKTQQNGNFSQAHQNYRSWYTFCPVGRKEVLHCLPSMVDKPE